MNLSQLKQAAERAIEYAKECGVDPESIPVTLQIDREESGPVWSDEEVSLHWDNNSQASGCVIVAFLPLSEP